MGKKRVIEREINFKNCKHYKEAAPCVLPEEQREAGMKHVIKVLKKKGYTREDFDEVFEGYTKEELGQAFEDACT